MSTTTIAQRPISKATAVVAVLAAVAIGSLSLFQDGSANTPTAPAQPQQTVQLDGHFNPAHTVRPGGQSNPTTSGGRVMVGQ